MKKLDHQCEWEILETTRVGDVLFKSYWCKYCRRRRITFYIPIVLDKEKTIVEEEI